ncbi:MAG TPA: peptidoglycan editing factor PgeF [Usitatibacter sp.]|nr:peptidoglycan editing factor PgeF [Usitatibacter sp.]
MTIPREWVLPDWPAPPRVCAFTTTRAGGVSTGEFASMNLGASSGDEAGNVARNRLVVREALPSMPRFMKQVHGTSVADLDRMDDADNATADAAVVSQPGRVAVVLTADCMPLLLCDDAGTRVAVAHAGWRGMAAGVIENTVQAMRGEPSRLLAWMGPAIGPQVFEVGPEVREAFMAVDPEAAAAFRQHKPGKFLADLYRLARQRLARAGVANVSGGGFCTYTEADRFFSYRRVQASGRMGTFIWIEPR